MTGRRGLELVGMLMIGDGLLSLLEPDGHLVLWRGWSNAVDRCIDAFAGRPTLTRLLAGIEIMAGVGVGLMQLSRGDRGPAGRTTSPVDRERPAVLEGVLEAGL
jgi:hypothetical protein